MKKIEAWKTTNDRIFEDKSVAEKVQRELDAKVQRELDAVEIFGLVYFHGIIESADDIVGFLLDNKYKILALYDIKEK